MSRVYILHRTKIRISYFPVKKEKKANGENIWKRLEKCNERRICTCCSRGKTFATLTSFSSFDEKFLDNVTPTPSLDEASFNRSTSQRGNEWYDSPSHFSSPRTFAPSRFSPRPASIGPRSLGPWSFASAKYAQHELSAAAITTARVNNRQTPNFARLVPPPLRRSRRAVAPYNGLVPFGASSSPWGAVGFYLALRSRAVHAAKSTSTRKLGWVRIHIT